MQPIIGLFINNYSELQDLINNQKFKLKAQYHPYIIRMVQSIILQNKYYHFST